jgi:hypothetical protein
MPQREITLWGRCPETGLTLKSRVDLLQMRPGEAADIILDVKSSAAETLVDFGKTSARLRYDWKMAHYRRCYRLATGRNAEVWLIGAFKKSPREAIALRMPNIVLQGAEHNLLARLREIAECERTGKWPGRAGGRTALDMPWPEWALTIPDDEDWGDADTDNKEGKDA